MNPCAWTEDSDCGPWHTACGHAFTLEDGAPLDNGMRWCCFCGGQLVQVPWLDAEDHERCAYCGYHMEAPCDAPPVDVCLRALDRAAKERRAACDEGRSASGVCES